MHFVGSCCIRIFWYYCQRKHDFPCLILINPLFDDSCKGKKVHAPHITNVKYGTTVLEEEEGEEKKMYLLYLYAFGCLDALWTMNPAFLHTQQYNCSAAQVATATSTYAWMVMPNDKFTATETKQNFQLDSKVLGHKYASRQKLTGDPLSSLTLQYHPLYVTQTSVSSHATGLYMLYNCPAAMEHI